MTPDTGSVPGPPAPTGTRGDPVVAFDIGGTWFRRAVVDAAGGQRARSVVPAPSRHAYPDHPAGVLKEMLVDRLLSDVAAARADAGEGEAIDRVGVSLGACLDGFGGPVYGSGPLWGDDREPFDLAARLRAADAGTTWCIVNDITAAALHAARHPSVGDARKMLLISVGSGTAARLIDRERGLCPLDRGSGIQGEIGHLDARLTIDGTAFHLPCDCGGTDHLASFASGRGLERVLVGLGDTRPDLWSRIEDAARETGDGVRDTGPRALFTAALKSGDPLAGRILACALAPLAQFVKAALCLDPHIDAVVLRGGLVDALSPAFEARLAESIDGANGLYVIGDLEPDYFARRLLVLPESEADGLVGAAIAARGEAVEMR